MAGYGIPKIWIIECLWVNDTISTSWKTLCTQDMMSLLNHRKLSNMGKPLLVTPLYDSPKFCLWLKPSPNLSKYLGFGSVSSWNSAEYPTSLGRGSTLTLSHRIWLENCGRLGVIGRKGFSSSYSRCPWKMRPVSNEY